jgi:hypothetical protein
MPSTLVYLWQGVVVALLLPLTGAVLYYLGYWAALTKPLWSRYPPRVRAFMACPACSGTWYCGILGGIAWLAGLPFLVFPGLHGAPTGLAVPGLRWAAPVLMALWGTYWVPFLAKRHIEALAAMPEPAPDGYDAGAPDAAGGDAP